MADGFFYKLGQWFGPKVRKGRWVWASATGSEADILEAERAVGADLAAALRHDLGVDASEAERRRVQQLGAALAACVKNKHRRFDFEVIGGEGPNAFALPGGFVFITRPLVDLVGEADDELAFVIGHEMGHVIRHDPMRRIVGDATLSAVVQALPTTRGVAGYVLKSSTMKLLSSAYSQERELLADKFGARLSRAAGHRDDAGPRLLRRLSDVSGGDGGALSEYFATHPPFDKRIDALRGYIKSKR